MKILLAPCLVMTLAACDFLVATSPAYQTCEAIALDRLKHAGSYEKISVQEHITPEGLIKVAVNFTAWNDYKVPIPHRISCSFEQTDNTSYPLPLTIKWNGRPIRQHELDDIRDNLKTKKTRG